MTDLTTQPLDPQVQRRNVRLGAFIGGVCLVQVVIFIILFSRNGLPKDPEIMKEIQAKEARQAASDLHP